MKPERKYQGTTVSKRESELIEWLQKGEHTFVDAFYVYKNRRKPKLSSRAAVTNGLKEKTWFNRTLNDLHEKGLCKNIPFVHKGLPWRNPGIESNRANFVALSTQQTNHEANHERNRII